MEQKLLTLPEHPNSSPIFSGVRVTRSLVLCVCFVDHNCRGNLVTNLVTSHGWGKNPEVLTTSRTYPWSLNLHVSIHLFVRSIQLWTFVWTCRKRFRYSLDLKPVEEYNDITHYLFFVDSTLVSRGIQGVVDQILIGLVIIFIQTLLIIWRNIAGISKSFSRHMWP
jgi:hypothetical protein